MEHDTTDLVMTWIATEFGPATEARAVLAGLGIGLALSELHPDYAKLLYEGMSEDFRIRGAGSEFLYEVMSIAAGEHRTAYEILADDFVQAIDLKLNE